MNTLDFKFISARNFMCYGPDGIDLDLNSMGRIILIRGDNMDVVNDEERTASNGSGKTSIVNIIVYTLYGKTINEKVKHADVIHNKIGKNLTTEVRWGKYRVVRGRKPDFLRLWESEEGVWDDSTEITLGGMPATQALILEKIGLSYEAFVNVAVFTDNNKDCFLECTTPMKREVVDNLLSLSKYRTYSDVAKKVRAEYKDRLKNMAADYERILIECGACEKRITTIQQQEVQWRQQKKIELDSILSQIATKRRELESSDSGAQLARYNEAQEQMSSLSEKLSQMQIRKEKVEQALNSARTKLDEERHRKHDLLLKIQDLSADISKAKAELKSNQVIVESFDTKKGTKCPVCYGEFKEDNWRAVLMHAKNVVESKQAYLDEFLPIAESLEKEKQNAEQNSSKIATYVNIAEKKLSETETEVSEIRKKISNLSKVNKPDTGTEEKVIESQIEQLKKQAVTKKFEIDGVSPHAAMLDMVSKECEIKKSEAAQSKSKLEQAESELPYYEFWVTAFGDSGIRKFVIDEIIPALNSKINHWLQFLIDGKIRIKFDNELEETIERNPPDGDAFVYHAMSGGERRRVNLAISQSFAHLMTLSYGCSPSFVFLDEVSTNVDSIGVQGIYNMIVELSKDKQVFITTHDHDLLSMLAGCECVRLVKKNGFTKLVKD
jgi:DNA repair exonuclease SbcCD ATPase subunit